LEAIQSRIEVPHLEMEKSLKDGPIAQGIVYDDPGADEHTWPRFCFASPQMIQRRLISSACCYICGLQLVEPRSQDRIRCLLPRCIYFWRHFVQAGCVIEEL
jgi:hypothetical protein